VEFELFAAYLIAAGAIERFLEIVSGWLPFRKEDEPRSAPAKTEFCLQRKADRGVMAVGLAAMVGTLASGVIGLYFMRAVGAEPPFWIDMVVTGFLLSGGTKTLHELLRVVQKARMPAT